MYRTRKKSPERKTPRVHKHKVNSIIHNIKESIMEFDRSTEHIPTMIASTLIAWYGKNVAEDIFNKFYPGSKENIRYKHIKEWKEEVDKLLNMTPSKDNDKDNAYKLNRAIYRLKGLKFITDNDVSPSDTKYSHYYDISRNELPESNFASVFGGTPDKLYGISGSVSRTDSYSPFFSSSMYGNHWFGSRKRSKRSRKRSKRSRKKIQ